MPTNTVQMRASCKNMRLLIPLLLAPLIVVAAQVDRIVAVIEDDVILDSELNSNVANVKAQVEARKTLLPPEQIIRRQVLERMIVNKLQLQIAKRTGIRVDDETLRKSVAELAQRNKMSPDEFRRALTQEGINYGEFVNNLRNEITVNQLLSREVVNRINVSDREIEHFLETQGKQGAKKNIQYRLGHILISTPEAASSEQIGEARTRAESLVKELRDGKDFKQTAIGVSDGAQALNGGDLGWRRLGQIPTIFVDFVVKMQKDDIQGPIRSPSGFHIIKLLDSSGSSKHMVMQHRVRHILIKPNELIDDDEARNRLERLKERIEAGDEFETLARANSDDPGSAIKGGDLGWVSPGVLVPPFEEAMKELSLNKLSEPVQTQFGWHLIEVLDRQERDQTSKLEKDQAREEIKKRKIEEESELWLRRMRDEAYVEIRLDKRKIGVEK